MRSRKAFTLIELLVSVALFVMAITIALFATVGSNGLLQRTETRGNILEGIRDSVDAIRRSAAGVVVRDVAIVTNVSYANQDNDSNPNITVAASGSSEAGLAVQVRKYGSSERDNVCYVIGRGIVKTTPTKEKRYQLSATGDHMIIVIFRLNATNLCEYSTILYRGQLSADGLNVGQFSVALKTASYGCGADSCSVGQIRYRLTIEEKQIKDKKTKRPAVDTSGSVPILTEQINIAPHIIGLQVEPTGPLTLNPGQKVTFSARAVYNDASSTDITNSTVFTAAGGSFNTATHEYTAGSNGGTYAVTGVYQGFQDGTEIIIQSGTKTLVSVALSPLLVCLTPGQSQSFSVIGTYSDSSQTDLTNSAAYALIMQPHGTMNGSLYQAGGSVAVDYLRVTYSTFVSNQVTINIQASCGSTGGETGTGTEGGIGGGASQVGVP